MFFSVLYSSLKEIAIDSDNTADNSKVEVRWLESEAEHYIKQWRKRYRQLEGIEKHHLGWTPSHCLLEHCDDWCLTARAILDIDVAYLNDRAFNKFHLENYDDEDFDLIFNKTKFLHNPFEDDDFEPETINDDFSSTTHPFKAIFLDSNNIIIDQDLLSRLNPSDIAIKNGRLEITTLSSNNEAKEKSTEKKSQSKKCSKAGATSQSIIPTTTIPTNNHNDNNNNGVNTLTNNLNSVNIQQQIQSSPINLIPPSTNPLVTNILTKTTSQPILNINTNAPIADAIISANITNNNTTNTNLLISPTTINQCTNYCGKNSVKSPRSNCSNNNNNINNKSTILSYLNANVKPRNRSTSTRRQMYVCEHPGCSYQSDRNFNFLRHKRTHGKQKNDDQNNPKRGNIVQINSNNHLLDAQLPLGTQTTTASIIMATANSLPKSNVVNVSPTSAVSTENILQTTNGLLANVSILSNNLSLSTGLITATSTNSINPHPNILSINIPKNGHSFLQPQAGTNLIISNDHDSYLSHNHRIAITTSAPSTIVTPVVQNDRMMIKDFKNLDHHGHQHFTNLTLDQSFLV
ncbi:hypothetical protein QR98_0080020 [Sarcoptes scabiei]|uniref:Uncharacterized protein n=1 Tax=Sarcoptes scabiei TaxID=52283 RepID=A0A132AFW5_SARSC|nr:hypothetical protein QR98_0080020 [Sarcoptes scabiei]